MIRIDSKHMQHAAALLLLLAAGVASALPNFLVIDGRAYSIDPSTIAIQTALFWVAPGASASQCSQPGGAPPPTSSYQLFYGPTYAPLHITGDWEYRCAATALPGACGLFFRTLSGNVTCAGEVPMPLALERIFSNGFNGSLAGFDATPNSPRLGVELETGRLLEDRAAKAATLIVLQLTQGNTTWCVPVRDNAVVYRVGQPIKVATGTTNPVVDWRCSAAFIDALDEFRSKHKGGGSGPPLDPPSR